MNNFLNTHSFKTTLLNLWIKHSQSVFANHQWSFKLIIFIFLINNVEKNCYDLNVHKTNFI